MNVQEWARDEARPNEVNSFLRISVMTLQQLTLCTYIITTVSTKGGTTSVFFDLRKESLSMFSFFIEEPVLHLGTSYYRTPVEAHFFLALPGEDLI